jgi:DNA repair exonuclease SbcCD ATPase subunit
LAGFPEDAADHADIDLASVVEEERTVSASIAEIGVKLPKLAIRLHAIEQAEARRRELQSELTKLGSDLEDLPVYEALARAYSKSGVKLFLIAKIAKMIETNLNHYSKLMYAEPYEFEFNVAHNKFDALVARKAGGRKLISDVRRLSGMERRTFSVLWLLALLPLIPKSRRSNLLILDEPEANMDPGMVEPFRDVLLPELNKLIPSIIIATPFDSLVTDKTRIVTVVKKGGESSLVEGKVT